METAASKISSLERKSVATKKPFFDPSLTYRNPKDLRGVVEIKELDPRKRIKELERALLRKDRALAETAALLVLSKKVQAIFNKGEDE